MSRRSFQLGYGPIRAYLEPTGDLIGNSLAEGDYLHGQLNGLGWTHGCLCTGTDNSIQESLSGPLPDPSTGRLYDVQGAYGPLRAYLNPAEGSSASQESRGNYLHGQLNGRGYTHGCLCTGTDSSILESLWDVGAAVPVAIDAPVQVP